ncbi:hypothetical protein WDZ92_18740 [Nostoc sp. NIES-2111]
MVKAHIKTPDGRSYTYTYGKVQMSLRPTLYKKVLECKQGIEQAEGKLISWPLFLIYLIDHFNETKAAKA